MNTMVKKIWFMGMLMSASFQLILLANNVLTEEDMLEAVAQGDEEKVRDFLYNPENNDQIVLWRSEMLVKAIVAKKAQIAQLLIDTGVSVNERVRNKPPLVWAILDGNAEIVTLLIDAGADLNIKYGGRSMLYLSLTHRADRETLEVLLDAKPDSMHEDDLLHDAASLSTVDKIKLLLDRGYGVNARARSDGNTPLHCAILHARNDTKVKFLLDHDANVHISNNKGETPISLAARLKKFHLVELLLQYS